MTSYAHYIASFLHAQTNTYELNKYILWISISQTYRDEEYIWLRKDGVDEVIQGLPAKIRTICHVNNIDAYIYVLFWFRPLRHIYIDKKINMK